VIYGRKNAQAKFDASQAAWDAADHADQVFGGRGLLEDF
jgi:alkylation response protein AidB-like acyl-CoA dehydrogenase